MVPQLTATHQPHHQNGCPLWTGLGAKHHTEVSAADSLYLIAKGRIPPPLLIHRETEAQ